MPSFPSSPPQQDQPQRAAATKPTYLQEPGEQPAQHSPAACPALQELEKALSCKYVASNAVTALQQVYQVSGNRAGQKGWALQAWARILLKPELGRVTEACHLLEQVALESIQQGRNYSQAQSKHCVSTQNYSGVIVCCSSMMIVSMLCACLGLMFPSNKLFGIK